MGQRLPLLKARELIRILNRLDFVLLRQKGSHAFFRHSQNGRSTIVPMHSGEDIDRGLLHTILKEIDVSPEEFLKMWKRS